MLMFKQVCCDQLVQIKKKSRWGRDFLPIQIGPGADPTSYKMGTRSFPRVEAAGAWG